MFIMFRVFLKIDECSFLFLEENGEEIKGKKKGK